MKPNLCFCDLSHSLDSLNSVKVLLHLGIFPLINSVLLNLFSASYIHFEIHYTFNRILGHMSSTEYIFTPCMSSVIKCKKKLID